MNKDYKLHLKLWFALLINNKFRWGGVIEINNEWAVAIEG